METRASYVLIGAFTLFVFVAAFVFVLWIGKVSLDREWTYYDIVFKEAVTGLSIGGAVQYNGIQVGEVRKLSLDPQDPREVIAHVRLNGDTPVKTDTHARLTLLGLTGVTVIQLSGGSPAAAHLQPAAGETAARIVADESALQSLLASGQDVATSANEVLLRVGRLLSDENVQHFTSLLDHVDQVATALADERDDLRTLVRQLNAASAALPPLLKKIDGLTGTSQRVIDRDLRRTIESAQAWLASVQRATEALNAILERNQEPIGRLGEDAGPALAELRETLRALRGVAEQLRQDPARYLLGNGRIKEFTPK